MTNYRHLGPFSDLVALARQQRAAGLFPLAPPGEATQKAVRDVLNFAPGPEEPQEVRVEREWVKEGVAGREITWSVGYGTRTEAWLLRPADAGDAALPGIVALHDHGGFKYFGKEKIADGPDATPDVIASFRRDAYGDRAFANALAREGFTVLVPDTFLWGSRKFPLDVMSEGNRRAAESRPGEEGLTEMVAAYNASAGSHEHTVEKYCRLLGTTLSGVISYEDRVSVNYLASRPDVVGDTVGCVGLSGGGLRSGLLQATSDRICAAVVVGLMSAYEDLLDHNVVSHTWMLFPGDWSRHGDWTDLVACRAPSPLLVQYDRDDSLFTLEGMETADKRLAAHYESVGARENYIGQFYPGPHKFDVAMQEAAFAWLAQHLSV